MALEGREGGVEKRWREMDEGESVEKTWITQREKETEHKSGKEREKEGRKGERRRQIEQGRRDMQMWSTRLGSGSQKNTVGVRNIRGQRESKQKRE